MTPSLPALLRSALLAFFDDQARDLPWRRTSDPYAIWVSEIMLQQTRVETVVPYFQRWMRRFPAVEELAAASLEEVLKMWEGLGYYRRARALHRAAQLVVEAGGGLPTKAERLRELPGIGRYTAGAIASIAFGESVPAVDGNAIRVAARVFDLPAPSSRDVERVLEPVVGDARPGDLNQAVMELGATVCLPRAPLCHRCPVVDLCESRRRGVQEERPLPKKRKSPRVASFGVAIVVRDAVAGAQANPEVAVVRRPEEGMLGGMWEFPGLEVADHEEASDTALRAAVERGLLVEGVAEELPVVDHRYSHLEARYRPWLLRCGGTVGGEDRGVRWVSLDELDGLPLPRAQRRVAGSIMGGGRE